jgi:capsular exopolysaccharide synthesis family protein
MSRIHEALKKAEQERAVAQAAEGTQLQEGVTGAPLKLDSLDSMPDVPIRAPEVTQTATALAEYLRFDDLQERCARPQWNFNPYSNVFLNSDLNPHGAEQFRTLRSRLYQLRSSSQTLHTLLITSSVPAEGKTFVTTNLAQAIVRQPDRRALIIDADLRRARLHVPLGAPSVPGLTDYLRGEADEMSIIQHGPEGNLCLIPGGNEVTNPSELLSNGRLKKLLDRLAPLFDWVLLDSPPCVPVADAHILADLCDGVILVVKAGSTPSEIAQKACQELSGRNVVGVVLNSVDKRGGSYYYYESYGYGDVPNSNGSTHQHQ